MVIELEARREAEAEQAAARAELRAEQLRLRQANAKMHALLGRLRARLGERAEAPEAWEGAAPSGLGSPRLGGGASPRSSSGSPRWRGSSSPPRWGGGGSPLSVPGSPRGVERAAHAPPPIEAWSAPPASGGTGCGCGAAPADAEPGVAAAAAEAAAAAGHGGAGGAARRAAGRAPPSSARAAPPAWHGGSEPRRPPPITPHRFAATASTASTTATASAPAPRGRSARREASCAGRGGPNGGTSGVASSGYGRLTPRSTARPPGAALRPGTAPGAAARSRVAEPARLAPTPRSTAAPATGKHGEARERRSRHGSSPSHPQEIAQSPGEIGAAVEAGGDVSQADANATPHCHAPLPRPTAAPCMSTRPRCASTPPPCRAPAGGRALPAARCERRRGRHGGPRPPRRGHVLRPSLREGRRTGPLLARGGGWRCGRADGGSAPGDRAPCAGLVACACAPTGTARFRRRTRAQSCTWKRDVGTREPRPTRPYVP